MPGGIKMQRFVIITIIFIMSLVSCSALIRWEEDIRQKQRSNDIYLDEVTEFKQTTWFSYDLYIFRKGAAYTSIIKGSSGEKVLYLGNDKEKAFNAIKPYLTKQ